MIHQKATYRFVEFIRPDSYWPMPYSVDQAFGVFRWMAQTGSSYRTNGRWGYSGVPELLSKKPTCVNHWEVDPICSITDLKERFHYAILSGMVSKSANEWRQLYRVTPIGQKVLVFPHYRVGEYSTCEDAAQKMLAALFAVSGKLAAQLNEYHEGADWAYGVRARLVEVRHTLRWTFTLGYGYETDSSRWYTDLATQAAAEPFIVTAARASRRFSELRFEKGQEPSE